MIQSTYLCYFAYQAQKLTIHRDFNLISSLGEIQDLLKDSKASSSSTTQKIYLIFFRRSKDFHSRQNSFEILQHIKKSAVEGFHPPSLYHDGNMNLRVRPRIKSCVSVALLPFRAG